MKFSREFEDQITFIDDNMEKTAVFARFKLTYDTSKDHLKILHVEDIFTGENITPYVRNQYFVQREEYRLEMYFGWFSNNTRMKGVDT